MDRWVLISVGNLARVWGGVGSAFVLTVTCLGQSSSGNVVHMVGQDAGPGPEGGGPGDEAEAQALSMVLKDLSGRQIGHVGGTVMLVVVVECQEVIPDRCVMQHLRQPSAW